MFRTVAFLLFLSIPFKMFANTAIHQEIRKSIVFIEIYAETTDGKPIITSGTGTLLTSDGLVLTSYHLFASVLEAEIIPEKLKITGKVGLKTGIAFEAELVDVLKSRDLAKINLAGVGNSAFVPACFDRLSRTTVPEGSQVLTSGFPNHSKFLTSNGNIIDINGPRGSFVVNIQSDDGQSGSPFYNKSGKIVGVLKGKFEPQPSYSIGIPTRDFIGFLPPEPNQCRRDFDFTDVGDPPVVTPEISITVPDRAHQDIGTQIIQESLILSAENGPFRLEGDLQIAKTGSLIIEAGTTIEFDEDSFITVLGSIQVRGTKANPVILKGLSSSQRIGIRIASKFPEDSRISHAYFERSVGLSVGYNSDKKQNQVNASQEIEKTLTIFGSRFTNSFLVGQWGSDHIRIDVSSSVFRDSVIHAEYPHSSEINIANSSLSHSKVIVDNYARRGIHFLTSQGNNTEVTFGCCSANMSFKSSIFTQTEFVDGNGSPVNGTVKIVESVFTDINYDLSGTVLDLRDVKISQSFDYRDIGIRVGSLQAYRSCIQGMSKATAVAIFGNRRGQGKSQATELEIIDAKSGIDVQGGEGLVVYDLRVSSVADYALLNTSSSDVRVQGLLHDFVSLTGKLFDDSVSLLAGSIKITGSTASDKSLFCTN